MTREFRWDVSDCVFVQGRLRKKVSDLQHDVYTSGAGERVHKK
jgi:hypothetical protein